MRVVVALASIVALSASAFDEPVKVDYCTMVEQPSQYAGRVVVFRARMTELKRGEWGVDAECMRPTLLVLPEAVKPKPDFDLVRTPGFEALLGAQRERSVFFRAIFVGRFDWIDPKRLSTSPRASPFGKSKATMRLVLREVSDAERIVIPRR